IQDNIIQRTRKETINYSLSANVNAHKLLPGKHGIRLPVSVNFQKSRAVPRFDPTDPDVPLEAALATFENAEEEANFRDIVEERQTVRSINFSDIRKEKVNPDAESHLYDIENFSFNYSFTETERSNLVEAEYVDRAYNGGVSYNYSTGDLSIEPFKESEKLSSPYLQLIKDININPVPNSFTFRGDLSRNFRKLRFRNTDYTPLDTAQFQKTFYFDRVYNFKWDLFKSLNIDYAARVNAIIDEPLGEIREEDRDSIWTNLRDFGRIRLFEQRVKASYTLPFSKLPLTDWVESSAQFAATYNWTSGAQNQLDDFGSVISNTRNRSIVGNFDMVKFYNKVKFLKNINSPPRQSRSRRPRVPTQADTVKTPAGNKGVKNFLRLLMSVRSLNFSYGITEGTTLPGFTQSPFLFGMDEDWAAPGYEFLLGSQDPEIRRMAALNGWLAQGDIEEEIPVTNPFIQFRSEDLTLKSTFEPLKDLRIEFDAARNSTENYQEIFRFRFDDRETATSVNGFDSFTPSRSGSYNITFSTLRTAFESTGDEDQFQSDAFTRFEENIGIYRRRLNERRSDGELYDSISQDVLIPAFLAAYSGKDANTGRTNPFPRIPLPAWRFDYAGLSNIPALKKVFSSVNITHGYRSLYSINNYVSNLTFTDTPLELDNDLVSYPSAQLDTASNRLLPVYVINQVTLSEQFQPLIGINVRTKNNVSVKIDYKKDRNLSLNLSNSQITETKNNAITVDFGVTKDKFRLPFKVQGRTVTLENDLTFRVALSLRDTKTIQRKINEEAEPTSGSTNFQFKPTLNYKYNKKLDVTAYFERTINSQRVGTVPERRTSAFGFQIRFSLAQ
ncbi:MAG: cell surface protein SprA, partial [Cyclobacteriaceae bacterium]